MRAFVLNCNQCFLAQQRARSVLFLSREGDTTDNCKLFLWGFEIKLALGLMAFWGIIQSRENSVEINQSHGNFNDSFSHRKIPLFHKVYFCRPSCWVPCPKETFYWLLENTGEAKGPVLTFLNSSAHETRRDWVMPSVCLGESNCRA